MPHTNPAYTHELRSECCLVAEHIPKIQRCYVLSPALQKWGIRTKRETPLGHTWHSTLLLDAQWALSVPHHFLFEATESLCQFIPWGLTLTTHTSQSRCKTMNISELRALERSVCLSVSSSPFSFLSFLLLDFSLSPFCLFLSFSLFSLFPYPHFTSPFLSLSLVSQFLASSLCVMLCSPAPSGTSGVTEDQPLHLGQARASHSC